MASPTPSIELPTQLEYYVIRDTLLGHNYVKQDVKRALELASSCQHPDAKWVSMVFAGKDVTTKEEAREVFLAQRDDGARALCFSALLVQPRDHARLRRSAEMGFAFAQAQVVWQVAATNEERFFFALRASLQGERDGFCSLGWCYEDGLGCVQDVTKAKDKHLLAAKLNLVQAMRNLASLLDDCDLQRWHWWGLASSRGDPTTFLDYFGSVVYRFNSDPSLASALFMIGRALKGHINTERKTIFGESSYYYSRIVPANRAMAFFSFQCAAARAAVDTWCLMARRINSKVNRDIRKKIGMLIWEARELGNYEESSADEVASQSKRHRPS